MDAGTEMHEYVPGVSAHNHSFLVRRPTNRGRRGGREEPDRSDSAGITERLLKNKAYNMPTWLEHPVEIGAHGRGSRSASTPTPRPAIRRTGAAYVDRINALDCPVSMEVGGFFGYINMWVGTEALMYLFYDDPMLVEDMMDTILHLETRMLQARGCRHQPRLGLVLGGHGLQERADDRPGHGAAVHAPPLRKLNEAIHAPASTSSTLTATATSTSWLPSGLRSGSTCGGRSNAPRAWTPWRSARSTAAKSSSPAASTSVSSCATRPR